VVADWGRAALDVVEVAAAKVAAAVVRSALVANLRREIEGLFWLGTGVFLFGGGFSWNKSITFAAGGTDVVGCGRYRWLDAGAVTP